MATLPLCRSAAAGALALAVLSPAGPALAAPAQTPSFDRIQQSLLDHSPNAPLMIAAHRGQWRDAPENSLAAIDGAIRDGAEIVEIDVQRTADGHLVLMHDETVDRTTDGTGKVSDLTLAQIRELRLKEHMGGEEAELTDAGVPTFEEAMLAVRGRALVNLDKGWAIRDDMYRVLEDTGTVDHALFKGSPTVQEAADFMATDPEILYMHIINDDNADVVGTFPGRQPVAYEVVFDELTDPQIQPGVLDAIQQDSRVWINTMWNGLAATYTDEASRRDPQLGWEAVVDTHDATMIQTDSVAALDYWRDGGDMRYWEAQRGNRTVRVQAEDYAPGGEGVGYHDLDPNTCDLKPEGDVDVCDVEGAVAVTSIEAGEWLKYTVDIKKPGRYDVSARLASDGADAGRVTLDWGDGEESAFDVVNTTDDERAFATQQVATRDFERGTHEFVVHIDEAETFNLDLLQFDLR
ncbi:glycerophosphodiester phosphodiesterase family protein [Nocardiopsis sediminis]|uniref:Glycerophosphodiester phosphodiesterase family protein n=1 Tax=Nocardiopsis sediminis TaxID=1778267 RepID=A0ABV8FSY0_9ACTN